MPARASRTVVAFARAASLTCSCRDAPPSVSPVVRVTKSRLSFPRRKSRMVAAHGGCARKGERLAPLAAAGSASLLEDSIVRVGFRKVSRNRRRAFADSHRRAAGTPSGQTRYRVQPCRRCFLRNSPRACVCVCVCMVCRVRVCVCVRARCK